MRRRLFPLLELSDRCRAGAQWVWHALQKYLALFTFSRCLSYVRRPLHDFVSGKLVLCN